MLIADLVKDFYRKLLDDRVLLLVAMDVDALAACKILQALFRSDHVQYTLVPVENQVDVEKAFQDHKDQYKNMVFLNCGGNVDLLEILQPPDEVTIYIVDSHRPVDLVNFYCERQVYLLMKHDQDELSAIPDYDDLYKDEADEDSEESDDTEQKAKRGRFDEEVLEKRRQRRLWEEKRKEILFEYEEFSYNGTSSSLLMYELAWKMSKDSNEILWWGIIGVTDQFQNKKIGRDKYVSSVLELQGHMSRLNHRYEDEENTTSINCMKITFEHDLDLVLYRHWSLFDSLCHSPLTATIFKVWTSNGMKRMHQFLAEMGIPLSQCKQSYNFMDSKVRENLQSLVEEAGQKFSLNNIRYQSFSAQFGYSHKMCASDVVHSVSALLENDNDDENNSSDSHNNFVEALDALSKINSKSLENGVTLAKQQFSAMKSHVSSFIEIGQVMSYGPFLYSHIKAGGPDVKYFSRPIYLNYFTHHLLHAYLRSLGKTKRDKAKNLPLVVCAPLDSEHGVSVLIGVPPLAEESRKNLFGRAFLHSAERTNSNTAHDYFDPCIMNLKSEDKSKFLDALITIMS